MAAKSELSAAITPCTIRHHCVMPHGRLSPYIKKNLHTHMRASSQWCCAKPIRRYYAAPHGGLSPNKSKKEKWPRKVNFPLLLRPAPFAITA